MSMKVAQTLTFGTLTSLLKGGCGELGEVGPWSREHSRWVEILLGRMGLAEDKLLGDDHSPLILLLTTRSARLMLRAADLDSAASQHQIIPMIQASMFWVNGIYHYEDSWYP